MRSIDTFFGKSSLALANNSPPEIKSRVGFPQISVHGLFLIWPEIVVLPSTSPDEGVAEFLASKEAEIST
jgi:hypothetical protein